MPERQIASWLGEVGDVQAMIPGTRVNVGIVLCARHLTRGVRDRRGRRDCEGDICVGKNSVV